ncbi:HCP-like protein [Rhizophagus irregularis]|uniref:HCP-like protein n=1 Tax=Rhizophagus irregularis TaxID=588596 RepID=A0A2N0RRG0_9GLOM|nr:HCP-like protein [Rhizophagus irregularis]
MTNNNINNNNNEDKNNTSIIDSISFESDIVNYDSSSFKFNITTSPSLIVNNILSFNNFVTKFFKELMQELYVTLLNIEFEDGDYTTDDKFNIFIDTFLLEYDLDPKNVLEIIISNSQNILCFSSLIGFFYQHGIGCEVNEIKASNIFSNTIKNNHKEILSQFSFDQKNKPISFCNDDIKELNGIIAQYFYSLLLYKNVIFHRIDNYKLHIKNAEKGDDVSQYYIDEDKAFECYLKAAEKGHNSSQYLVANYYYDGKDIPKNEEKGFYWTRKAAINGNADAQFKMAEYYINNSISKNESKAFKWYMKLAKENKLKAIYLVAKCYRDGIGTDKNLKEATTWIKKYELSKPYFKPYITLYKFLDGADIDVSSIASHTRM